MNLGDPVQFRALDQDGGSIDLQDFRGRPVVLFLFPRANTPG